MLNGKNGILNKAWEAKKNTENATDLEYLRTKAYEAITNYYVKGKTGTESDYVLEELGQIDGVTANIRNGTIIYNEKMYDISEIIGNTIEQKTIEKAGLSQITVANVIDPKDKEMLEETDLDGNIKIRMIIVEETTDKGTVKAVIPSGFYYVTGTPSTGLVISDKFGDDNENSKGGNQFVWVPCDGKVLTYEKHTYATASTDDTNASTPDTANGNWQTYKYRNWSDWTDDEERESKNSSVTKYNGFYVGRI